MRLDDLYKMTAYIYHDGNMARSKEATLLHFVEVCGMLTMLDRKKKREKVDFADALCKALGWYFPLLAKMGVESVEKLLFTKYPGVCPYCREVPHVEAKCKLVKGTEEVLSHEKVQEAFDNGWSGRPNGLNDWQTMFSNIYPRTLNASSGFSSIALLEELGEISEAVRVFERYPHYFYGEAADAFSYLMGLANEYELLCEGRDEKFDYEAEFLTRYPGLCVACGGRVCICPTVPPATVGRMAKEMPLNLMPISDADRFDEEGKAIADKVLDQVGHMAVLSSKLPFDRGELNAGLSQIALRLSMALDSDNKELASDLKQLAISLTREKRDSGTEAHKISIDVIDLLKKAWVYADPEFKNDIAGESNTSKLLTNLLDINVLLITAVPRGEEGLAIRVDQEVRKINEAIQRGKYRDRVRLDHKAAATIADFRIALVTNKYEMIHFAGHACEKGLEFEGEGGVQILEWHTLEKMLKGQTSLQCLLLNACDTMLGLEKALAPLTIGMVDEIDDGQSLPFAEGFYDALVGGRSFERAFEIGCDALEASKGSSDIVTKITCK